MTRGAQRAADELLSTQLSMGDSHGIETMLANYGDPTSSGAHNKRRPTNVSRKISLTSTVSTATMRNAQIDEHDLQTRISHFVEKPCTFVQDNVSTKLEVILRILTHHTRQKTLISTSTTKAAKQLSTFLHQHRIVHRELKGNFAIVASLLRRFESGEIPVLILNGQHTGAGLNIHMADLLIVSHVNSSALLMQLIGRAQRPKRDANKQLLVYCLTFCGEKQAQLKRKHFSHSLASGSAFTGRDEADSPDACSDAKFVI